MKELGFFFGTEFQVYINISGTKKPFLDCFYGNSKVEEKNCLMATKPVLGSQPCVLKSCPKWENQ